jgi:hypothetical protein
MIHHLVLNDLQNINIKNNYVTNYLIKDLVFSDNNYKSHIQRNIAHEDLYIPLHIIFTMNEDMNCENFVKIIKNSSFEIYISNYDKPFLFNLGFLSKLYSVKKINNSFVIKLPLKFFIGYFSPISLTWQGEIIYTIDICHEQIKKIEILYEYLYLVNKERENLASKFIYQNILDIIQFDSLINIKDNINIYTLEINENYYALGFFIESDENINTLEIKYKNKTYSITDCEIRNENLLYFSFVDLLFEDTKNFTNDFIKINDKIEIFSTSQDLKFYLYYHNSINYHEGYMLFLPIIKEGFFNSSGLFKTYNIKMNDKDKIHNMYIKLLHKIDIIEYIENKKIFDFYDLTITEKTLDFLQNEDYKTIRFCDCIIDYDVIIPENIENIIFENTNIKLNIFPNNISELLFVKSNIPTDLPLNLKKIIICGKYDIEKLKIPFGCELINKKI